MHLYIKRTAIALILTLAVLSFGSIALSTASASVAAPSTIVAAGIPTADTCGGGDTAVKTSIDIGCKGKGNGILDATFAIIRFLSNGVGLVLIGSLVWGGIQFSMSRSNPQAVSAAQNRIKSTLGALVIFIFTYAILNYLVPGNLLK